MSRAVRVASVVWGVSILLSRLVGLARESVIGRTLGNGAEADVYWTAFVLPDFLNYLMAGGVLSLVFIPMFGGYLSRDDEVGGWRAFSLITNFILLLSVAATAILWWRAPVLAPVIAPGMTGAQRVELVTLIRIILPAQVFHLVGGLLSATLQARDRHVLPALAPVFYTGLIVVFGLALGGIMGARAFAWGVLAGSIVGPFGLPLAGCLRAGLGWRPILSLTHPDFRRYFLLALPVMLGFSVVVLDDMVIKHFGSEVGEGVISRLQYARTLMKVPMGVFGLAAGVAAFPTLSRLVATGRSEEAYATLVGALRTLLVLAFAAQAALTAAGTEVATVIWGRARFTPAELADVGAFTGLLCIGLWAWSAQGLVARGFYARQNTWVPTVVGSGIAVAAYPLYGWLAERAAGTGLAIASSAAISVYVAVLYALLRRRLGRGAHVSRGLVDALVRLVPATALGVAAGLGLGQLLPAWPALLRGAITGGVATGVTLGAAALLGVPEVRRLAGLLGAHRRAVT